jgi:Ala-tRNA(Pro) deacylase
VDSHSTYRRLLAMLDAAARPYRLIDHPAEGHTGRASELRGHPLAQAAKCIVVGVRVPRHRRARNVLAVVPGTAQVDLGTIRDVAGGTRAGLAARDLAERLTGCAVGSIVPFHLLPTDLELIADPWLMAEPVLYFNAARLDRSIALRTTDYLELAQPRLEPIAVVPEGRSR